MALEGKRILFYTPGLDVIHNGVYYSQVFGLARQLVQMGATCLIVYTDPQAKGIVEKTEEGVALISSPQISRYIPLPFLPWKLRKSVEPIEKRLNDFEPTHVYIRDTFAGVAAFGLVKRLKAKIVFSCRGAGMAEGYTSLKEYVKEGILRINTRRLARRSAHVNAVCERLRIHLARFYKGPMSVLPCCVMPEKFMAISSDERKRIRSELNIPSDAHVVVYSGGMGWYQCTDELLGLFKALLAQDPELYFLILSRDQPLLQQKMAEIQLPVDHVRIRKCEPQEVSSFLQSADVGVIIRKNDTLNRLASPVKIGEYLASGLGIIVSPWIGDVGQMLADKAFAFMYTGDEDLSSLCSFARGMDAGKREKARAFARGYYTYEENRDTLLAMFSV